MEFSDFTIKSVLIIVNTFNIICAIIHIGVTIFNYKDNQSVDSMVINYINMVFSGICCASAFVGSTTVLEIISNIFVSEVVATMVIWIYGHGFCTYTLISMVLHSLIASIAYVLLNRLRKNDLLDALTTNTSPAMMPLNPQTF